MKRGSESDSSFPARVSGALRKLIRSKWTNEFLTNEGTWTEDVQAAADFPLLGQTQQAVKRFHLRNVELYYLFGDRPQVRYDFALSLG